MGCLLQLNESGFEVLCFSSSKYSTEIRGRNSPVQL